MNYTVRNLAVASMLMLLGIVAVISFIRTEQKSLERGKEQVQVLVAAKDIPAGTPADELEAGGYLDTKDVLREDAPPFAVGKVESIEGLVSNEAVVEGDFVTESAFNKTTGLKPTAQIKGNERLFSVPINGTSNVADHVRAGDHVDIVAGLKAGGDRRVLMTVVARDIEVIDTPDTLKPDTGDAEASAPSPDSTELYVLKATDREWMNIQFAQANSDDFGLMFGLRPASGDAESKLPPIYGTFDPPTDAPIKAAPGPDPSVR